jgi:VanZ family protein
MRRHRSSAAPLAWLYAGLIVYASLYPFTGWRATGVATLSFLLLPWSPWWSGFDLVSNLLGYLPLGALVFGALVRTGRRPAGALLLAVAGATLLSLSMETLQSMLPARVASNVDLALNAAGAALGAGLGLAIHLLGGVARWQAIRDRWFIGSSAGGLALLVLWPLGLLFPTPLPMGVGQVLDRVQEAVATVLQGTWLYPWVEHWQDAELRFEPLAPGNELLAVALGLLAPCLLAFTISQPGWRRLLLVAGAAVLGFVATTLSTALNFGPQHALAWSTATAVPGFIVGGALAALLAPVSRRAAAGFGLVVLTALVALVAQAPADPYFAQSLHAWEQGRFIRFHGAAQWVGWVWPYATMAYMLARVSARDPE